MHVIKKIMVMAMVLLLFAAVQSIAASVNTFDKNSLFNAAIEFTDQDSAQFHLSQGQGKVQIVAFVYTHCISVCPVIVADLKRLESLLPKKIKQDVAFVLVSLDPESDTPATMKSFLQTHALHQSTWHFVRGNNDDTREFSLLFDVRYRQDATEIAHSNMISVLDTKGILIHQRKGNASLNETLAAITQALNAGKRL
jgi:protein SCO1